MNFQVFQGILEECKFLGMANKALCDLASAYFQVSPLTAIHLGVYLSHASPLNFPRL